MPQLALLQFYVVGVHSTVYEDATLQSPVSTRRLNSQPPTRPLFCMKKTRPQLAWFGPAERETRHPNRPKGSHQARPHTLRANRAARSHPIERSGRLIGTISKRGRKFAVCNRPYTSSWLDMHGRFSSRIFPRTFVYPVLYCYGFILQIVR